MVAFPRLSSPKGCVPFTVTATLELRLMELKSKIAMPPLLTPVNSVVPLSVIVGAVPVVLMMTLPRTSRLECAKQRIRVWIEDRWLRGSALRNQPKGYRKRENVMTKFRGSHFGGLNSN